jgi:hypothetical protein
MFRIPFSHFRQGVLRAFFYTLPAVDAKMNFEGYFGFHLPGFDVLAPETAQGATLEKNQAPYPRTVMKTEMLQREDEWLIRSHGPSAQ